MRLATIGILAALGLGGCDDKGDDTGGGGDGGSAEVLPTCDDAFTACGGDAVGSWTFLDFCFDFQGDPNPDCPDATYDADLVGSGSLEVGADGSYDVQTELTVTMTVGLPKECLGPATCEQVAAASGMECTDLGDECSCVKVQDNGDVETGTWTADGSTLTLQPDDSVEPTTAEFCATGSYLQLLFANDEGDMRMILERGG